MHRHSAVTPAEWLITDPRRDSWRGEGEGALREPRVFADREELFAAAAEHVAAAATRAIAERGRFLLVLAGGTTPADVYARLGAGGPHALDGARSHFFWGDERCVPPDHPESNYGMAARALLNRLDIPPDRIHRIRGEEEPGRAAADYDAALATFFRSERPGDLGSEPAFDLVLLGIGADGHTASLFPGSPALAADGWAVAAHAPDGAPVRDRVTLTLPAIDAARECLFVVAGAGKRQAVAEVFQSPSGRGQPTALLPAGRVSPHGRNLWFLDTEAWGSLTL